MQTAYHECARQNLVSEACTQDQTQDSEVVDDTRPEIIEPDPEVERLLSSCVSQTSRYQNSDKCVQVTSGDFGFHFTTIVNSKNVKTFTGILTFHLLLTLEKLMEKKLPCSSKDSMSTRDKIVMTMMILKHMVSFEFVSHLFGICPTTCSNIFRTTVKALSAILNCAIMWPTKEEVLHNLPECFRRFSHVRVVVDCTEIQVGVPRCLQCRLNTYSHYKKMNTFKYMVGVSPGGLLTYVSKGYGSRASDKTIFEQSGLVDMLLPGIDHVMADKGFLIDDICESRLITVGRPPFLRAKKNSSAKERH
ncbi:uncharacterized protein LOC135382995 [Ornithodoros turicata]|uniref:uncharacterized protein LOC135382995 n=1 Tax=Ornithodoros turicata TaxID=34597 RepID=UPI003139B62B